LIACNKKVENNREDPQSSKINFPTSIFKCLWIKYQRPFFLLQFFQKLSKTAAVIFGAVLPGPKGINLSIRSISRSISERGG